MKKISQIFIFTALCAGLIHILHEIYQFVRAVIGGSFAFTIYYNRHGEAWADAIAFVIFLIIAIVGLILYVHEIKDLNVDDVKK